MNVCAYCRKPGKITKEHLYPQFLYRRIGPAFAGYNEAADKVTRGERVIRDVCVKCNNESLGALDGYGQKYFQTNNLDRPITDEKTTEIFYDYDLLLRWVLKISYNSFRTVDFADNPFASLTPFILTGQNRPKQKFVKLLLEVVRSHRFSDEDRTQVPEEFQQLGYIPCYILCSGRAANSICETPCHCRHLQVNAHRFNLLLFPYSTKASDAEDFVRAFQQQFPFSKAINPNESRMSIAVSNRDICDIHAGVNVHPWERLREREFYEQNLKRDNSQSE